MEQKDLFSCLCCGKIKFSPFVLLEGKACAYAYTVTTGNGTAHIYFQNGDFKDDIYLTYVEDGIIAKRTFENLSDKTLCLKELGLSFDGIDFSSDPAGDYFYHAENVRRYSEFTMSVDRKQSEGPFEEPDLSLSDRAYSENVKKRTGTDLCQPFPAILLSNYGCKKGLVHGTLSQDVFYHNYTVKHESDGLCLKVYSSFKGAAYRKVGKNEVLTDEWYLGKTEEADDVEKIFDGYTKILREKLASNHGATGINRRQLIWGSWNDGLFRNINEKILIEEAKAIKENFPNVKWFQLDDGYAVFNTIAHGLGVPYEGEEGIDHQKFPDGLRAYSDKIREIGLIPTLWIGGLCPTGTKIRNERPDWFCDYSFRMTDNQPLDVSRSEVRS